MELASTAISETSVYASGLRERKERTVGRRGVKVVTMVEGIVRST